jgi:radical SAM superfamily enzyme YgiQ (UPF0313 family)
MVVGGSSAPREKPMKIALLDLNHSTRGVHTNTVPLGLGLIAAYLNKTTALPVEIKIFKDTYKALDTLKEWVPDVLGITQYSWNTQLNLFAARRVKELNPGCFVIAGGPNIYQAEADKIKFLKEENYIDICVVYDGEIIFAEMMKRLAAGESKEDIKSNPESGSYALHPKTADLVEPPGKPARLKSLDVLGTPYADGVFDEFLQEGYHPFVQTHRGCPFSCAFCHTSAPYYNRMLFLSPELFRRDIEYLGKRFRGKYHIPLYIANTNWSLFKEDFAIARVIKEIKEKYDWPHQIHINSGKDPEKLIEMLSVFRYMPGIPLQTLTPHVLENIKRKNIPFEEYIDFQNRVSVKTGRPSATELILCLPGETRATFMETLVKTMDSGTQNIIIYTLMKLRGTPLDTPEYEKKYQYLVRYRIVPRQFSEIDGTKIFDTEAVIVGTNTMSFDDYIELRSLCFTISAFLASSELIPLVKLISEYKVRISAWIFKIHEQLANYPDLFEQYQNFLQETRDELFPTNEKLIDFFSDPGNYAALLSGNLGDNLLRKYKNIVLFDHFDSFLDLALKAAGQLMVETAQTRDKEKAGEILASMKSFLSTRNMKSVLNTGDSYKKKLVRIHYDVPAWLSNSNSDPDIENFRATVDYLVKLPEKTLKELDNIAKMNKDLVLSLQILYRDGTIKEFWPEWHRSTAPDTQASGANSKNPAAGGKDFVK